MRIDKFLATRYGSRTKAAQAVESGQVLVNGKVAKPSFDVGENDDLTFVLNTVNFVSLGGYKLDKALTEFRFDANGKVFADIGASTGGFTDCLFKNGAKKVYCIDVGENQLDESLKNKNVVIYDNFNARNLTADMFEEKLDAIVIDVSFISLTYILSHAAEVLEPGKHIIALIKPQFECESRNVGKNGIVKSAEIHEKVIQKIYTFALGVNLAPKFLTTAPITKGKNIEYLMLFEVGGSPVKMKEMIKSVKL